jgi:hypothetical protein
MTVHDVAAGQFPYAVVPEPEQHLPVKGRSGNAVVVLPQVRAPSVEHDDTDADEPVGSGEGTLGPFHGLRATVHPAAPSFSADT